MWVCKYCETENWDNNTKCECCGREKIQTSSPPPSPPPQGKFCPRCLVQLPGSPTYCPRCGKKLSDNGSHKSLKRLFKVFGICLLIIGLLSVVMDIADTSNSSANKTTASSSSVSSSSSKTASTYSPKPTSTSSTPSSSSSSSASSTSSTQSYSGSASTSNNSSSNSSNSNRHPSDDDLTASGVTANIRYPKDKYYLSEYKYGYINAPKGNSVNGFKYSRPSDGTDIVCYPKHGASVTVLAIQYGRACVIVDSTQVACWVNEDYITYS